MWYIQGLSWSSVVKNPHCNAGAPVPSRLRGAKSHKLVVNELCNQRLCATGKMPRATTKTQSSQRDKNQQKCGMYSTAEILLTLKGRHSDTRLNLGGIILSGEMRSKEEDTQDSTYLPGYIEQSDSQRQSRISCQGVGGGENGELVLNRRRFQFGKIENFQGMDSGTGGTDVQ